MPLPVPPCSCEVLVLLFPAEQAVIVVIVSVALHKRVRENLLNLLIILFPLRMITVSILRIADASGTKGVGSQVRR